MTARAAGMPAVVAAAERAAGLMGPDRRIVRSLRRRAWRTAFIAPTILAAITAGSTSALAQEGQDALKQSRKPPTDAVSEAGARHYADADWQGVWQWVGGLELHLEQNGDRLTGHFFADHAREVKWRVEANLRDPVSADVTLSLEGYGQKVERQVQWQLSPRLDWILLGESGSVAATSRAIPWHPVYARDAARVLDRGRPDGLLLQITDPAGAPAAGAEVSVVAGQADDVVVEFADHRGWIEIPELADGAYRISVRLPAEDGSYGAAHEFTRRHAKIVVAEPAPHLPLQTAALQLTREALIARADAGGKVPPAKQPSSTGITQTLKQSQPAANPAPAPASVCGPDVTDNVLDLMATMRSRFRRWGPDLKRRKCDTIVSVMEGAPAAWDINMLSPSIAPPENFPSMPSWFEPYAARCARPRSPCGPTVTFLGQCFHSQVVNYIQWGAMNELCTAVNPDQWSEANDTHPRWDTANALLRSGSAKTDNYDGQILIAELGAEYMRALDEMPGSPEGRRARRLAVMRLQRELAYQISIYPTPWAARPESICATACRLTRRERARLDFGPWSYIWMPNR